MLVSLPNSSGANDHRRKKVQSETHTLEHELLSAAEAFVTPLRAGDGFDENKFRELCRVLEQCAHEWAGSNSIPKKAANLMIELWAGIQKCQSVYTDDEQTRISLAADVILDLSLKVTL